jgi:glycine hydroxymethyltransferase
MLFAKQEHIAAVNTTIFPGTSGGPHEHQIAATGQALLEILGEDHYPDKRPFKAYAQDILDTCKALEAALADEGLEIVSPTQNHLCLVKLPQEVDSLEMQRKLEALGIITNRNMIPFDTKTAWRPSGMRLGTAALTSRGVDENQAGELGKLIADVVHGKQSDDKLRTRVNAIVSQLSWWYPKP